jgi:hypothetical protein
VSKPCERQEHSISTAADDAKTDQDDGDRVECGAEKEKGFVVMKRAQHFACGQLWVERQHRPPSW